MAGLIPGYEYDIFISYRQKDNEYDGWVTEFINNLKRELHATFKEDISIYFDASPQDGLLETHIVDESLWDKLKCLIFIPIISQTYCDSKSFAWKNEFVAFNKIAKKDRFGRDIRLTGGNIASRILPVKIHDLDPEDKTLLEEELGGVLRGIEFIYKSAGVNRPLRAREDHPQDNLNNTYYRDQINKVANAIKEIIIAIKRHDQEHGENLKEVVQIKPGRPKKLIAKIILSFVIVLIMIVLGYFFIPGLIKSSEPIEKSIAVLPFENLSNDPEQEYFTDGMVDEILDRLFKVGDLKVIARTSSMRYKNSQHTIKEIAHELGVSSILEGSVRKSGSKVRITVQMIDARTGFHTWSNVYDRDLSDVFLIQSEVAQNVARELKATLTIEEKKQIEKSQTNNPEAYNLYLQGRFYWNKRTEAGLKKSAEYFERSIAEDKNYALAFAGLADSYFIQAYWGWIPWNEGVTRAKELALKAIDIDKNLAEAHTVLGALLNYGEWKWEEARKELQLAIELNPNFVTAHHYYSELLNILRQNKEARRQINLALQLDPFLPVLHVLSASYFYNEGKLNESLDEFLLLQELDPEYSNRWIYWGEFNIYLKQEEDLKAVDAIQKALIRNPQIANNVEIVQNIFKKSGTDGLLKWLIELELKKSQPASLNLATLYTQMGNKEEALNWLEKIFEERKPLLPTINNNSNFDSLRSEPRFKAIIEKLGLLNYTEKN